MNQIIIIDPKHIDKAEIKRAAHIVRAGGAIVFPTDTFYALGVNPYDPQAVAKVYQLKRRKAILPMLLLISDVEDLKQIPIEPTPSFSPLAHHFWPGALTIVVKVADRFPANLKAGGHTLGFRLPQAEIAREIVRQCGFPITGSSANISGQPPSSHVGEVMKQFGTKIDLIIDGGTTTGVKGSTILDLSGDEPTILREGDLPWQEIQAFLKVPLRFKEQK
ncbi:MAG: L-threonylcarbamoyladenylate synthase [Candidatus Aminicenantes bacterium]|nr:L-threonylcarbamoyladenylate synthase [Candidatus Aminicenantes bacterium]MDH5714030.1 L-threonylcarbamoyladenylate synthase [Candidatus Aminicenantes bacterium]